MERQVDSAAMQIRYLDGPRLRRSLLAACEHARLQRAELNRINVFPVPDGDTGTNLALTLGAIMDHLRGTRDRDLSVVAYQAAQGAVVGARGNCGMMLSHFLLGFAESVGSRARIDAQEFGLALVAGSEKLHAALEQPVEGTILTVIRDAAQSARRSVTQDFVPLVTNMVSEARRSLAGTPDLLPVLKEAGVVDAGAKGFVGLLEGVLLLVNGELAVDAPSEASESSAEAVAFPEYPQDDEHFQFCTEALVRGPALPTQDEARNSLRDLGDSLIVIRAGDVLKVHIHSDEPEAVFTYLRGVGTLVTHKAEDMRVQRDTVERAAGGHVRLARRPVAIMTDSACDLSEEIIRAHGIHVTPLSLVEDDQVYRDGVDITATEFHERLRVGGVLPTTSQPTQAQFLETYSRALEEGEAVVGVLAGSTLSGTFQSAEAAAARVEGGAIHLVDSLGASLLQGLLVLKATELAELGQAPNEIVAELRRIRARSGLLFTVATFERLIASGRVGRGQAMVGRLLTLKPIIGLSPEGVVLRFGQALGQKRARVELLRILREQVPQNVKKVRFGVVHVGIPEIVEEVSSVLRAAYGRDVEILSGPITPVIATHLGIGAWGVVYLVED
ncbi:MAG: DegV family EDD domain-containing protein [Gemmatimonadota bacterium]|nr:DegV family EDD domain-containing protein [Gemmatimonadota bacterium]